MSLRRADRRGDLPLNAEINVTSLVDVAFVLLIVFIIVLPALQGGVEVSLPNAAVQPLTSMEDVVIVTITADGTIYYGETALTYEEFQQGFSQMVEAGGIEQMYLKADRNALYGNVLRVIAAANAGNVRIGLIAEPEANAGGGP